MCFFHVFSERNCYYRKLTFDSLYNAYIRASLNKRNKRSVIKFSVDLETYLSSIYNELYNNSYKSSKYREFIIYEPKKRIIKALPFRDRIVHQWYVEEFIKPYIIPRLINTTFACLPGTTSVLIADLSSIIELIRVSF